MREDVLVRIAAAVPPPLRPDGVVRVGIDGVDGSGKTTMADELAAVLSSRGRAVVRVSIDDFHRTRAARYARGRRSPEGFYRDSFDVERFRREVLDPLGPTDDLRISPRGHDLATDEILPPRWMEVAPGSVLVVDGVFLHRTELSDAWDLSVWLEVPFEVTCARMAARDSTDPDPAHLSVARYVEGQRLYLAERDPRSRATLVVDNSDVTRPRVLRDQPGRGRRAQPLV